jgi:TonB family protein
LNENLQGRLSVNLRVDTQGNICSSSISNDSVGDGNVASCVLGMFRGARVTPPTGGCVDVSIPLNFQPKGK